MPALTDAVKTDILTKAVILGDTLLLNAPDAATKSAQAFLQRNDAKIAGWLAMVAKEGEPKDNKITPQEFASLVQGLKDLEDMDELSKKVQQQMAVEAFASSLIVIVTRVGLASVLGPGGALVATAVENAIAGGKV